MSDEANAAASNAAANEEVQTADTQPEYAQSAREAVERAFSKVNEPAPDAGQDNQQVQQQQARGEDGKFVKADPAQQAATDTPAPDAPKMPDVFSRYTKEAQALWQQVPELWRTENERAIAELTQGLEKYKGDAERYAPIQKYYDMAEQGGTTLDKALEAYTNIENAWRLNPAQGFLQVSQNLGIDPYQHMAQIMQQLGMPQPQFQGQMQQENPEVVALKQQLAQLQEQFGTVEKTVTESQQQAHLAEADRQINDFAKDKPYFDDVADSIAQMLETGFANDLSDAYEKAIRLNPDVLTKIEADKAAAAAPQPDRTQTQEKASKSITGSPNSGSNPATRKPAGSAREALQTAFANVGLS